MALPKDFKQEQTGGKYTLNKLKSGDKVKFRVLSDFIDGKSVWGDKDGKRVPTRVKLGQPIPTGAIGVNKFSGNPESIKQFIAAVVWNYQDEQIEIFETDKATIIGQIVAIEENDDWGDCKQYDLTVSKKGEGMDTEYNVLPSNKAVFKCPEDPKSVNLQALYSNEDPFAQVEDTEDVAQDAIEALAEEESKKGDKAPF